MLDAPERPPPQRRDAARPRPTHTRLPASVSRQVARFALDARAPIRKLIRRTPAASDLAEVFPGLLFSLACQRNDEAACQDAERLLAGGAQLKSVARAVGVPMWLRRLPPDAFIRGVTGDLSQLPRGEAFSRRVATRVAPRPADAADWLAAVSFAARAVDEDFALWIARQRPDCHRPCVTSRLAILAAYAWQAGNPGNEAADLVWTRWRPEMALETAVCAAQSWLNRLLAVLHLGEESEIDPWLTPAHIDGLEFVPLTRAKDLLAESRAMRNCTDQYAITLATGRARLFSIRREGGARVATLEIAAHPRERGALAIAQLKAHCNLPAPLDVWQAAHRFMALQSRLLEGHVARGAPLPPPDRERWQGLLADYRRAVGGAPWLPEDPADRQMTGMQLAHATLARECGVRSWLFNT